MGTLLFLRASFAGGGCGSIENFLLDIFFIANGHQHQHQLGRTTTVIENKSYFYPKILLRPPSNVDRQKDVRVQVSNLLSSFCFGGGNRVIKTSLNY